MDYVRPPDLQVTHSADLDETRFQAPESQGAKQCDAAADVFSLAMLLQWLFLGECAGATDLARMLRERLSKSISDSQLEVSELDALAQLLNEAQAEDPAARVDADQLVASLERLAASCFPTGERLSDAKLGITRSLGDTDSELDVTREFELRLDPSHSPALHPTSQPPKQIGRFRLLEKLGEGGMGAVFKAEDLADGSTVALKLLSSRVVANPAAVRRFRKEARMLSEIRSPFVTNLVEVNQDNGIHYIVMEFVAGMNLRQALRTWGLPKGKKLDERSALSLIADVARGLSSAHERGIIHRDIKPENILLAQHDPDSASSRDVGDPESLPHFQIKLSDFGLARQLDQSESMEMTREGGYVGTPAYMPPEQFTGEDLTPAGDVYSLGITLYEMLAGKPPFVASEINELINLHCNTRPPQLRRTRPEIMDATSEIVQRAIAKDPKDRFADAAQFLREIEGCLRGEIRSIDAHPHVPAYHPNQIFEQIFEWDLQGEASDLWPYVSNTERINNAVGVPSVVYQTQRDEHGRLRKLGSFRMAGLRISWEEHPFEWIEGQRLGILREFHQGPFQWFLSIVELSPRMEGGTRLRHTVRIRPRGLVGRGVATLEVSLKGKRNLDRVYGRIDKAVTGGLGKSPTLDPFTKSMDLPAARKRQLEQRLDRLAAEKVDPAIVDCLGRYLREAPAQELGRIRPLALARNFSLPPDDMVTGCLAAANVGLLDLHWDILCPTCRISSQVATTLRDIESHANCEVCDLDFDVDLAKSVEMVFRVHPDVREADVGTYCIGGPEHSPHVVMQLRLQPGKRVELNPVLSESEYVLRSAQIPNTYRLRALPGQGTTHTEILLSPGSEPSPPAIVRAGRNVVSITNDFDREIVVRLERSIPQQDIVTAAKASSMPLFRNLFPQESPQLGTLINVSTVTLLAVELFDADRLHDTLEDAESFTCIKWFHDQVAHFADTSSASIIKVMGTEALLSVENRFEIVSLVAGLDQLLQEHPIGLRLRGAAHCGTALATSGSDHLEYFGRSVHQVRRMLQRGGANELWMTEAFAADPLVARAIGQHGFSTRVLDLPDFGRSGVRCQQVDLR